MIKDGDFHSHLPITGSHEPCGTVEEVGSEVKGFKKGDRIGTLPFMHPCGECPDCKSGTYIYCDKMEGAMGISTDGAFGEVSFLIYNELRFSTLFAIHSLAFVYPTRFHLNMLHHYSVPELQFTVQSSAPNSEKEM
jgi:threonine dehydrogenase-like Zn-dependent dehydrogenase